jgi:hypothetical protein
MKRLLSGLALFCVFGLISATGYAQNANAKKDDVKKDDAAKKDDAKKDDKKDEPNSEKMLKAGQLSGKVVHVDESKRGLKVQLTYGIPKLNDGEYRAMLDDQAKYAAAIARKDFRAAANHQAYAAMHQAKLYTMEKKTKDVELQTTDDLVVRVAQPPAAFDDKGLPKKYTQKELDELKGPNKKLPGYNADFSDLRSGQMISIELVKKQNTEKPPKFKTKEEETEWTMANLPKAHMVVIVAEPQENK